jgi:hypothetical protein
MSVNQNFAEAKRKVRAFAKKDRGACKKIYFATRNEYTRSFADITNDGIRNAIASVRPLTADKDPIIRAHSRGQTDALKGILASRKNKGTR